MIFIIFEHFRDMFGDTLGIVGVVCDGVGMISQNIFRFRPKQKVSGIVWEYFPVSAVI